MDNNRSIDFDVVVEEIFHAFRNALVLNNKYNIPDDEDWDMELSAHIATCLFPDSANTGEYDDSLETKQLLGSGCHDQYDNTEIQDPFSIYVDNYINSLNWTSDATEEQKTLVSGNIRSFAHTIRDDMLRLYKEQKA